MTVLNASDLQGRVVIVTGASGGIGQACVQALDAAGATVAGADLASAPFDRVIAELNLDKRHSAHCVDISDQNSVNQLISEVVHAHGHLDGVINTAAILETYPFLDIPLDSWERTFAVNTRGSFLMAQAVARQLVKQGTGGRIVLVASNVGFTPRMNNASYASSKAAVIHLVRSMAMELSKYNITVNALCPGSTATKMLVDVQAKGDPKRLEGIIKGSIEQWRTGIPLGRLAEPEDQAAIAVFLMTEAARYITGQAIRVDGGQTLF